MSEHTDDRDIPDEDEDIPYECGHLSKHAIQKKQLKGLVMVLSKRIRELTAEYNQALESYSYQLNTGRRDDLPPDYSCIPIWIDADRLNTTIDAHEDIRNLLTELSK